MKKLVKYNFLKNYTHLIFLLSIVLIISITFNFYSSYKRKELEAISKLFDNIYLKKTLISVFDSLEPRQEVVFYKIESGDTFAGVLKKIDIDIDEQKLILDDFTNKKKLFKIFKNQNINFKIDRKVPSKVLEIDFEISKTRNLIAIRNINTNKFDFNEVEKNLKKQVSYKESKITNSLYSSAININIKPNIIIDFARIYGFQVDFQRDIWKNDIFQIIFEEFYNDKNELVDTGNILYANLILQGKENPLYYFKTKDIVDHYDDRGQSIKKTLMKTPINGARLSSKFGKRKHPILGFTKMHTGTDFAAPTGTPIMASGDGKITKASWCGGGGNCIKIKHNSTYTTVYAHLSKFGRGIKKGRKVKQGQIIGYVGSTGLSTGPHLHYEVIENGRKINSQTLKLPSGKTLKGDERKNFEIVKIKTNVLKSELIAGIN